MRAQFEGMAPELTQFFAGGRPDCKLSVTSAFSAAADSPREALRIATDARAAGAMPIANVLTNPTDGVRAI